jgi:hypothetical protein
MSKQPALISELIVDIRSPKVIEPEKQGLRMILSKGQSFLSASENDEFGRVHLGHVAVLPSMIGIYRTV